MPVALTQEEIAFYRGELSRFSREGRVLDTAQTLANIRRQTGWSIAELAKQVEVSMPTVSTYLKLNNLPVEVQNVWAAGEMSNVVALLFVELDGPDAVMLLQAAREAGCSLKRRDKLEAFMRDWKPPVADSAQSVSVDVKPEPQSPSEARRDPIPPAVWADEFKGPIIKLPSGEVALNGIFDHLGEAALSMQRMLCLPCADWHQALADAGDLLKVRRLLQEVVAGSETLLSLLRHVEEAAEIRTHSRSLV